MQEIELMPHQLSFYDSDDTLVFFGGGAGGGKTFAALIDNLQGIHDPHYISAFFRTTTTEISKGLWLEAKSIYNDYLKTPDGKFIGKAHISEKEKCITFPSGAKTYFSYLEQDKHADNWYGLEIAKIYFEECQFRSWYQFTTLLSRNRSKAQVKKGFRATLNPDRMHWVYSFVKRYLDDEGYPIKDLSGKTAYYLIVKDELFTAWTKEELIAMFPPEKGQKEKVPLTYTYIPATVEDNKKLLEFDPTYKDKLDSLPEIKRRQLLEGCWVDVSNEGLYFREEWLKEADRIPTGSVKCRAYDLAFSEKTPTTDPDYTVGIGMARCPQGDYYLFGDHIEEFGDKDSNIKGRMRKRAGERDMIMLKQAQYDTPSVKIVIPEDAGAAGKDAFVQKVKFFTSHGFVVKRDVAAHNAKKLTKAEPFFSACENGIVYIVKDSFTKDTYRWLMKELSVFDGITKSGRNRKDDAVDTCATGFNYLAKEEVIPSFVLPEMGRSNPFDVLRN